MQFGMRRGRRTRRPPSRVWRWVLGIAIAVGCGWMVVFVSRAEARLAQLPALVQAQLAAHGSSFTPLDAIAPNLIAATVAVEDRSFWTNPGISPAGIARSAIVDLIHDRFAQGGSTITQQLVRDQLLTLRKTLSRKLTEVAYALLCAVRYRKDEVMALYLNEVNYGNGAFGIAAAARTYFHVLPANLSLPQSALLAGLPQDPAGLDPFRNPKAAHARELIVLQAMVQIGAISQALADKAALAPVGLVTASQR